MATPLNLLTYLPPPYAITAFAVNKRDPIRRISQHSIDLAQRRQYFPAIAKVERDAFG